MVCNAHIFCSRRFLRLDPLIEGEPHTEHQLLYLHNEFGASPRSLALFASKPEVYEAILRQEIDRMDPNRLQHIFQDPGSHHSSHHIVIIEPSPTSRFGSVKRVASQHILELLWDKHIQYRIDCMSYFYNVFQANPITAAAAEWIFELRMHQLLRKKQAIQLFPVHGHCVDTNLIYNDYTASENQTNPTNLKFTRSEEHDLVKTKLEENHYYRPKSNNFLTIDSLLLVHSRNKKLPTLLMFRITGNESGHDVNKKDLCIVDSLEYPSNTPRYFVVVTPKDTHPRIIVPREYFGDRAQGQQWVSVNKLFPVFHYPICMEELFAP